MAECVAISFRSFAFYAPRLVSNRDEGTLGRMDGWVGSVP